MAYDKIEDAGWVCVAGGKPIGILCSRADAPCSTVSLNHGKVKVVDAVCEPTITTPTGRLHTHCKYGDKEPIDRVQREEMLMETPREAFKDPDYFKTEEEMREELEMEDRHGPPRI
jgi:hypothetical protein